MVEDVLDAVEEEDMIGYVDSDSKIELHQLNFLETRIKRWNTAWMNQAT